MSDKFIVSNDKGMSALPHVLRKHKSRVNVYSFCPTDKNTTFTLGWDDRPDSDWGKYRGARLRVIVTNSIYRDRVESEIRKTLGWEPNEDQQP